MNADLLLVRLDPSKNMARYYRVLVEPTLFGVATRRVWGRVGRRGREQIEHHATTGEAEVVGARYLAQKLKRGYRPAKWAL